MVLHLAMRGKGLEDGRKRKAEARGKLAPDKKTAGGRNGRLVGVTISQWSSYLAAPRVPPPACTALALVRVRPRWRDQLRALRYTL